MAFENSSQSPVSISANYVNALVRKKNIVFQPIILILGLYRIFALYSLQGE